MEAIPCHKTVFAINAAYSLAKLLWYDLQLIAV